MERGKVRKMMRGLFFFFFFCFSLENLKFVLGLPKWGIFYRKKAFQHGKKSQENDFAPSEKYSSYALVVGKFKET